MQGRFQILGAPLSFAEAQRKTSPHTPGTAQPLPESTGRPSLARSLPRIFGAGQMHHAGCSAQPRRIRQRM